jgi:molybdopterin-guanine dinucleotide biosynthesis protein A
MSVEADISAAGPSQGANSSPSGGSAAATTSLAASVGAHITGIVLAGGMGRRMGGIDKGLVELDGQPMVAHVLARLAPQVGPVLINANQNPERYAAFGYPVVADAVGGFAGPLAGLHAGMTAAKTPFVVTVPCDSPFLPLDLVARLAAALARDGAQLAVARTFDQPHPVFALVNRDVFPHLASFLHGGGRKIDAWYATLRITEVPFDDCAAAFRNINTADELAAASGAR